MIQPLVQMKKLLLITLVVLLVNCTPSPADSISLDRKVGQLFLLAYSGSDPQAVVPMIEQYGIGGLYLSNENLGSPVQAAERLNFLQQKSMEGPAGLPLLTAGDQEGAWGIMVPHSATGPGNMALGASPVMHTRKMYEVFGKELAAIGLFCNLSPVADVNSNPNNPIIGTRSFGEDPEKVAERVQAAIEGLHASNVMATLKHFPGHGNTSSDSHSGLPVVNRSLEAIESVDMLPFRAGVKAGADLVMTAHITYKALDPDNPATLSKKILTDYLRKRLVFKGVIITDSFNMWAIQKKFNPKEAAVQAIAAGADMIMLAEERYGEDVGDYITSQRELIEAVVAAVKNGTLDENRVDEAYNRIVTLKEKYQLSQRIPVAVAAAGKTVGQKAHLKIAQQAAEAAVTVIQSNTEWLPIASGRPVVVVRLASENVTKIMEIAEGIGPNYADGFRDFVRALQEQGFQVSEKRFDQDIPSGSIVLAVGENYPLPGKSLDLGGQQARLDTLRMNNKEPIIYIGLRDPYDAQRVDVDGYVSAIGSNRSNARAMARYLSGKVAAEGQLPVTPMDHKK